jgi:arylsulfatase A-like enzyme
MKRRSTLLSVVAALAVAVPTAAFVNQETEAQAATTSVRTPNVLVVVTDDMRQDDVKYMPRLRAFLGKRGVDFRNSFAPTPLCCPNRASYLTGRFAHNHEVWWHDAPWGYGSFDDRRTLGTALQAAGYRTGYVGKYLNRYGLARPKANPKARPATWVPAGWDEWRGTPDGTGLPESDPRAGGTYRYFDTTVNVNGKLVGHQGVYNSKLIANEGIRLIDRFAAGSAPWYLQVNSLAPHHGGPTAETLFALDRHLQRVWDKLAATGELDETIIVFTSDNGYMQGEHRWQSGKVIGFDPSYRVPLLIAGPGVPQGTRHYAPVSTMDVTASVLDWTGAQLAGVDGRSFVGDLGANVGWDRAVGYEAHFPGLANRRATVFDDARRAIGIRTARYFYVRYANGQAELFDLERDPLQLASVARDPAYAATRRTPRPGVRSTSRGTPSRTAVGPTARSPSRPRCGSRRGGRRSCGRRSTPPPRGTTADVRETSGTARRRHRPPRRRR